MSILKEIKDTLSVIFFVMTLSLMYSHRAMQLLIDGYYKDRTGANRLRMIFDHIDKLLKHD